MKINEWDICEADAKQWNVIMGYHSIDNESEWARGSPIPILFQNEIGFKPMKITLLIKADGRQDILGRCSEILSHLLAPAELTLDGFEHKFCGILKKHSHSENAMRRWHTLTLEFDCYEYGPQVEQTFSGTTSIIVSNSGNIVTPAVIVITPQIGAASVELTGICRDPNTGEDLPVTVRELTAGKKVILDGEAGLFTEDGKLKASDIDIWGVPVLLPGNNKIAVNNNRMDIAVQFRPRFM